MTCDLAGALHAAAAENEQEQIRADKSPYHLFNPTPRKELREMSTDRPDKTESAYTVDAGHFQVEMDVVSYTHDRDKSGGSDTRTDAYALAPVNLKLGLLNNVDFQLMLDTYNHVRAHDRLAGTVEKKSGFGDVTTRLKVNFWGNDGGPTALAMMPFMKFPANQDGLGNNAVEGGIIFPLAVELPRGWGMGMMTEFDFLRNEADSGYHTAFVNSITFAHDICGKLGGYVEFFSEVSTERGSRWVGTVDLGLTYGLTDDIQLDAGVNIGATESADDVNPFVGLSWRF
jgi:Putative MetA-pathway of phenol degradation